MNKRAPTHPGELLLEEFIKPAGLSQAEVARAIGVSKTHLNGYVNGQRSFGISIAIRLGRFFNVSPEFWLNLRMKHGLFHELRRNGKEYDKIRPFRRK